MTGGGDPLYALPNKEESEKMHITNSGSVIRSNLLELQVDQLLSSTKLPYTRHDALKAILHQINTITQGIESQMVSEGCLGIKGLPLKNHVKRKEVMLEFQKPKRMDLIGSYILETATKLRFNIDIAVEMPSECFVPKDFLNHRYMDKRSLYLGVLALNLKQATTDVFESVQVMLRHPQKPVLVLKPKYSVKSKYGKCEAIHIHPVVASNVFQLSKLLPSRANIKDKQVADDKQIATPHYNNSIVQDMNMVEHTKVLHAALKQCPSLSDAIVLAKIWTRQRALIDGFEISMFLLYLLDQHRINAQMSAEQMFKVLMHWMATEIEHRQVFRFTTTTTTTSSNSSSNSSTCAEQKRRGKHEESPAALASNVLQTYFDLSLIDASGMYNITARITSSIVSELRREAKHAIALLQQGTVDTFQQLFVEKNDFFQRYDEYIRIPMPVASDQGLEDVYSLEDQVKCRDAGLEHFWCTQIDQLLQQALTDRVHAVRTTALHHPARSWDLHSKPCVPSDLVVGVLVNAENAFRSVDKGPAADDKVQAKRFREFWGSKAELRRFKDGSIVEAVVWDVPLHRRHDLLLQIVRYIVHLHVKSSNCHLIDGDNTAVVSALSLLYDVLPDSELAFTENTLNLWAAFNALASTLRELSSLPLEMRTIQPACSALRYTSPKAPTVHPLAFNDGETTTTSTSSTAAAAAATVSTVLEVYEIRVELENSCRWPDDIDAVRHTKTAFCAQMAQELIREKKIHCEATTDYVDVFTRGYVFRLRLVCDKEWSLLSTAASGSLASADNRVAQRAQVQRELMYAPQHTNLIHALQSRCSTYSPTVRFVRQWLDEKALSLHLPLEAVELLVAHVVLHPSTAVYGGGGGGGNGSILSNFMRFLRLVFKFDWATTPLIVDLKQQPSQSQSQSQSSHESAKDHHAILQEFQVLRKHPSVPQAAMYIVASYEERHYRSSWTENAPIGPMLQKLQVEAKEAYEALQQWLTHGLHGPSWTTIFLSDVSMFDAIIELDSDFVPSASKKFQKRYYRNASTKTDRVVFVGFDPVQSFLSTLQSELGHLALFFHSPSQPDQICLVWQPPAFVPHKLKVSRSKYLYPIECNGELCGVPDVSLIYEHIRSMGHGIVSTIHLM